MDLTELNDSWQFVCNEVKELDEQMKELNDVRARLLTECREVYKEALCAGYKLNKHTLIWEE